MKNLGNGVLSKGEFPQETSALTTWTRLGTTPANAWSQQPTSVIAWAKALCSATSLIQIRKNNQVSAYCEKRGSNSQAGSAMGTGALTAAPRGAWGAQPAPTAPQDRGREHPAPA